MYELKHHFILIFLFLFLISSCSGSKLIATPTETKPSTSTALPTEIINSKNVTMRLIPAGDFTMGSDTDSDPRNQSHTVYLDSFYMDKYEVTNTLYADCVNANVCKPPQETNSDFRPILLWGS